MDFVKSSAKGAVLTAFLTLLAAIPAAGQTYQWVTASTPPAGSVTAPVSPNSKVCRGADGTGKIWVGYWGGTSCIGDSGSSTFNLSSVQFITVTSGAQSWYTVSDPSNGIYNPPPSTTINGATVGTMQVCTIGGYVGWLVQGSGNCINGGGQNGPMSVLVGSIAAAGSVTPGTYQWVAASSPPKTVVTAPDIPQSPVCSGLDGANHLWIGFWNGTNCVALNQSPTAQNPNSTVNANGGLQFLTVISGAQVWAAGTAKAQPVNVGTLPANTISGPGADGTGKTPVVCSTAGYVGSVAGNSCEIAAGPFATTSNTVLLVGTLYTPPPPPPPPVDPKTLIRTLSKVSADPGIVNAKSGQVNPATGAVVVNVDVGPMIVKVVDGNGTPVPNVTLTASCAPNAALAASNGGAECGLDSAANYPQAISNGGTIPGHLNWDIFSVSTNAQGQAAFLVNQNVVGSWTTTVTLGTQSVAFSGGLAPAGANPATNLSFSFVRSNMIGFQNPDFSFGGAALFPPVDVQVVDSKNNPAANIPVHIACNAPSPAYCAISTGGNQTDLVTNAKGIAEISFNPYAGSNGPFGATYLPATTGAPQKIATTGAPFTLTAGNSYNTNSATTTLTALPPLQISSAMESGCIRHIYNNSWFTWQSKALGTIAGAQYVTIPPGGSVPVDWFALYTMYHGANYSWTTGEIGQGYLDLSIVGSPAYSTTLVGQSYTSATQIVLAIQSAIAELNEMNLFKYGSGIVLNALGDIAGLIESSTRPCSTVQGSNTHMALNSATNGDISISARDAGFGGPAPIGSLSASGGNNQSVPREPQSAASTTLTAAFSPLQVTAVNSLGAAAASATITWTCTAAAPMKCQIDPSGAATTTTTTNSSGVSALSLLNVTGGDGAFTVTAASSGISAKYSLTVAPPPSLKIYSGNNQVIVAGSTAFNPISVQFTDASGKGVAGIPVTFACAQCGFSGNATSDSNGIASIAYTAPRAVLTGNVPVTVTAPGASPTQVSFSLTIQPHPPTMTLVSGNSQSLARTGTAVSGGMANFNPLQAKLVDGSGTPIANATITWTCIHPGAMVCQIDPTSTTAPSTTTTTTDANGLTTLNKISGSSVRAYYADGVITVTAAYGTAASTSFGLTVYAPPPPPPAMTLVAGNNQSVARAGTSPAGGTATFAVLSVLVSGSTGSVANLPVTFTCGPGLAPGVTCQVSPAGASFYTTATDARGMAVLPAGPRGFGAAGPMPVTVTTQYGSATFNLTISK